LKIAGRTERSRRIARIALPGGRFEDPSSKH
jgi:hypothetical protein